MKNILLAATAIAVFGLAGCAKDEKMMKDDTMVKEETMMKDDAMVKEETMVKDEVMVKEESGGDPMMDLCFEKGGSIGEWPGESGSTKTCDTADGNSYPLASLTSFEAFQ